MNQRDLNIIHLSQYGGHLLSRLYSRDIFLKISGNIDENHSLILDFKGVSMITSSFATELLQDLIKRGYKNIEIRNANSFLQSVLNFAIRSMDESKNSAKWILS